MCGGVFVVISYNALRERKLNSLGWDLLFQGILIRPAAMNQQRVNQVLSL